MPQTILLCQFGEYIHSAFGHVAYRVGSSLAEKTWRDVDVRLLIPDDEYEAKFGLVSDFPYVSRTSKAWIAIVLAWTTFGRHITGLPIDFQIQPVSWANANESKSRGALLDIAQAHANSDLWDRAQKAVSE